MPTEASAKLDQVRGILWRVGGGVLAVGFFLFAACMPSLVRALTGTSEAEFTGTERWFIGAVFGFVLLTSGVTLVVLGRWYKFPDDAMSERDMKHPSDPTTKQD